MQGTLDSVEKAISKEDALAKKALADGDRDAFFEHSRKRAVAEKKRDEINETPCNGSGCSAEEVEAAWNQHKESASYRKKLEALCSARNAYIQSIREIRQAYKQEVDKVKKFRELAATSGCGQEIVNEMEPPRNLTAGIAQNLPSIITSGVESLVSFTDGLKENVGALIDSGLEMVKTLADGIVESLPALIENVPLIVSNIANIINENAPKLLTSAAEIIAKLVAGLISNIPVILANLPQIIGAIVDSITAFNWINLGASIIKGVASGIKSLAASFKDTMGSTFKQAMQSAMDAIKSFPNQAIQWGRDMVSGFVSGIMDSIGNIVSAVSSVASTIKSWLHFSRPDIGPLRDYEKWMPDMMAGMARGIRQNAWQLEDALNAATSHMAPIPLQAAGGAAGSGVNMGGVTIQINAPAGMDVNALADAVAYRLQTMAGRKEAVW